MSTEILTTSNIMFVIGLMSVIFTIYNYFKTPQIKADKFDALMKQNIEFLTKEFNERFNVFDKQLVNLRDNHLHTINEDIKSVTRAVNDLAIQVGKLETKIDERVPRGCSSPK